MDIQASAFEYVESNIFHEMMLHYDLNCFYISIYRHHINGRILWKYMRKMNNISAAISPPEAL